MQYFSSTHGARKGLADTALKTANSGYLTRRLVDVAQDGIIRSENCKTEDGLVLTSRIESGEITQHVSNRVMGRVAAVPVMNAEGNVIFDQGHLFIEDDTETIINEDIDQIKVRSVINCRERYGFCATCFGRDLARGNMVSIGETVGVIAAQSIGEPGTQLTMRTFHIGGTATAGAQINKTEVSTAGVVKFDNVKTALRSDDSIVVLNKVGEVIVKTEMGVEKERYPAIYGAQLFFKEGDKINVGDKLMEWDPFSIPVLSEVAGRVKFEDLVAGASYVEQTDLVTGISSRIVQESKGAVALRPRVILLDDSGESVVIPGTRRTASYRLPVGSQIVVEEDEKIDVGGMLAKVQRESTKTRDITGGLPRVAELFEARKPNNASQISDINGTVEFGPELRGNRRVVIRPEDGGDPMTYTIPKGRYVTVNEGTTFGREIPLWMAPPIPTIFCGYSGSWPWPDI